MVISPLMALQFTGDAPDIAEFAGLIFTSENAVNALARASGRISMPCHCVGQRAASAAASLGARVETTSTDLAALETLLLAAKPAGPLLYLHGQHVTGHLADRLCSAGIATVCHIAYSQQERQLTVDALALLQGTAPLLVPLFSRRSAQLFQAAVMSHGAPLWVAALSPAVADAFTLPVARRAIAASPDAVGMLDALAMLLAGGQVA